MAEIGIGFYLFAVSVAIIFAGGILLIVVKSTVSPLMRALLA
jgi:hypothetical protein